ncbi:MAG: asparagine synthetase B, partial [Sphaerospermopsis kisseleviana]
MLIARDRMGEKPIYLFRSPGVLIFASELKSLLKSGLVRFQLDPVSIYQYFHYAYVPEPRTPLTDVFKLKPGHFLLVDVNKWDFEQKCYWQMEDVPPLS